ncbi:MAG: hypothetical protein IT428_31450 [Planctomycetaceae bacterium]|nr:hypothetical protein [Planctomycetaceae bacterium]
MGRKRKTEDGAATDGGLGGTIRQRGTRDTRLIEKAIKQRWPIPAEKRAQLIERQLAIATAKNSSNREATAAFRAIMTAEAQNQADEHKAVDIKMSGIQTGGMSQDEALQAWLRAQGYEQVRKVEGGGDE